LASRPEVKADARIEVKSFYKRLLEKSSKELIANGMNRKIIKNKLNDFK
jgi:hypothetical protein